MELFTLVFGREMRVTGIVEFASTPELGMSVLVSVHPNMATWVPVDSLVIRCTDDEIEAAYMDAWDARTTGEAETLARVTGSVAATVRHESRDVATGEIMTIGSQTWERYAAMGACNREAARYV